MSKHLKTTIGIYLCAIYTIYLGPGLLIGLVLLKFIDFPTFLISSIIFDVEPLSVIIFNLDYPLHGFFHSYLGGAILALPLAIIMKQFRKYLSPLMSFFKLEQEITLKKILVASFAGIYIHILFDSPIYTDIQPLYPLVFNPFFRNTSAPGLMETMICIWCFIGALIFYISRLTYYKIKERPIDI